MRKVENIGPAVGRSAGPVPPALCMRSAFKLLKPHKADGTSLLSDHLIFVLPAIEGFVADLFTCILHHGYMPAALHDCILVPIPKGNKDPTSSDNYHPVALAAALSKALEWSILLLYPNHFTTSDLQFGFKKGMSTALWTGFIKNVVLNLFTMVLQCLVASWMRARLLIVSTTTFYFQS